MCEASTNILGVEENYIGRSLFFFLRSCPLLEIMYIVCCRAAEQHPNWPGLFNLAPVGRVFAVHPALVPSPLLGGSKRRQRAPPLGWCSSWWGWGCRSLSGSFLQAEEQRRKPPPLYLGAIRCFLPVRLPICPALVNWRKNPGKY